MFAKKTTAPAVAPVATNMNTQNVDTVISSHCTIDGNVRTSQSIKLDGRIEGNVQVDSLMIIGTEGQIHGDAQCNQLLVLGQLHGNVKATHLHLQASARIHGNIETQTLQIDPGAQYHGSVTMEAAPKAADTAAPYAATSNSTYTASTDD